MIKWNKKHYHCPVEVFLDLLSGKWKWFMLWSLNEGKKRYKELKGIVPGVCQKMLKQQLKELEKDGFIARGVYRASARVVTSRDLSAEFLIAHDLFFPPFNGKI